MSLKDTKDSEKVFTVICNIYLSFFRKQFVASTWRVLDRESQYYQGFRQILCSALHGRLFQRYSTVINQRFSRASTDNLTSIDQETFNLNSNKVVVTRTQKASGSLSGTFDLTLQMMNGTTLLAKGRLYTLFH